MKTRVLVIDDSAFMRRVISEMINDDRELEVIGTARNGEEALKKAEICNPHVITLDLNMPMMDGIEFMERFFTMYSIPVIVISSYTQTRRSDKTIKALELGAFDFIPKPSGEISLDIEKVKEDLQQKIKLAASSKTTKVKKKGLQDISLVPTKGYAREKIIFIGASTGGPRAIKEVLQTFHKELPTGVLIVQHMPAGFTNSFAKRLNEISAITVKEAREGDSVEPGVALIAPGDYHLILDAKRRVVLLDTPRLHGVRPAVDISLLSVAEHYKEKTIAVILTGMGKDGADGMSKVKQFGGRAIVQDENTSVVFGMPKAVIDSKSVDLILPIEGIGQAILESL